jgi:hypothetical protein
MKHIKNFENFQLNEESALIITLVWRYNSNRCRKI